MRSNRITGARFGVDVATGTTGTEITDNTVAGGEFGIRTLGAGVTIDDNRIGTDSADRRSSATAAPASRSTP